MDLKNNRLAVKILLPLTLVLLTLKCVAGVTDWIDFTLDGGHVKIPATIAGIDTYAILDTGSQINAINKAFTSKNDFTLDKGRKIKVKGAFGIDKKTTYNNVPVTFFGTETEIDNMAEINLGDSTNGILFGAPFFNMFVIQLDYPNKKMRLISRDSIDLAKFKNIKIQSQKQTGMPIVRVSFPNDEHLWLVFDTGNAGGMMVGRNVAEKMGWLEYIESQSNLIMGANSIAKMDSFRIPSLKFGPFELESVLVNIPAEGEKFNLKSQYQKAGSMFKGRKVQGLIGYDILKHFLITIDYKSGYAHIGLPEA